MHGNHGMPSKSPKRAGSRACTSQPTKQTPPLSSSRPVSTRAFAHQLESEQAARMCAAPDSTGAHVRPRRAGGAARATHGLEARVSSWRFSRTARERGFCSDPARFAVRVLLALSLMTYHRLPLPSHGYHPSPWSNSNPCCCRSIRTRIAVLCAGGWGEPCVQSCLWFALLSTGLTTLPLWPFITRGQDAVGHEGKKLLTRSTPWLYGGVKPPSSRWT